MYQVFTDGSSSRKYGTIGSSYIIFKDKQNQEIGKWCKGFWDEQGRNGIAELLAVFYFLKNFCDFNYQKINKNEEIIIYSDSQYVVNEFTIWFRDQMLKNFYETKNKYIIMYVLYMLYILREEGYIIKFQWIKGHQKEETFEILGNNLADNLAVSCHKGNILHGAVIKDTTENIERETQDFIEKEHIFDFLKSIYL